MTRGTIHWLLATWIASVAPDAASALDGWACAGVAPPSAVSPSAKGAAAAFPDAPSAIVIFGHFADEALADAPPAWSAGLLDPERPGSVAHFYETMSFGRHRLSGEIAPRRYASAQAADAYGPTAVDTLGQYGRFALEILRQADADIDFSRYDNDGPDGDPNSGDDDGFVDVVFLNIAAAPSGFVLRDATGIADLGFELPFETDDVGAAGKPIRIDPGSGTLQAVTNFDLAAGVMAHEYGHLLGLPDLYDVEWTADPSTPEDDSAGIGRWGLMGWGATGWPGAAGPVSLSAWSRLRLGWARPRFVSTSQDSVVLPPVTEAADIVQLTLNSNEFYLLENRQRDGHYDRGIPGEGLLVWHVSRAVVDGELAFWWDVDLECADGLWADAGYPIGREASPVDGGDNLDFWAHDQRYAETHGGNLGDATDPFDGVRYRRFALDTNPSAATHQGIDAIAIEQIATEDGRASFLIRTNPPRIEVRRIAARAPRVTAGTAMAITFQVANIGDTPAPSLRAELQTDDPVIELVTPDLELFPLDGGATSVGRAIGPDGFPRVRFPRDLDAQATAQVDLVIFAGATEVARQTVEITGVPSSELTVQVVDDRGEPVEGILVSLPRANERGDLFHDVRAFSAQDGRVRFHLPAGTYTVAAAPDGDSEYGRALTSVGLAADTEVQLVLPGSIILTGSVRHADGTTPVREVRVSARSRDGGSGGSFLVRSDGTFTIKLTAGVYDVTSGFPRSGGLVTRHGEFTLDRDTHLDLELAEGKELTVEVRDPEGHLVPGAEVVAFSPEGDWLASGRTGQGRGARMEVQHGTYDVLVMSAPAPWVRASEPTPVTVSADTTIAITLVRGVVLRGRFVTDDGSPFFTRTPSSVSLNLLGDEAHWIPSRDTRLDFEIAVEPGTYRLSFFVFRPPGAEDPELPSQVFGPFDVASDTTIEFSLSRGVLVQGQLIGYSQGDGAGFSSQRLTFSSAAGGWASGDIGPDGSFALRVVPGEYDLQTWFSGEGFPPSQSLGPLVVTGDTTITLRLVDDQVVEGRISLPTGEPAAAVRVAASSLGGDSFYSNIATSSANGAFRMRLPPGRYHVWADRSTGSTSIQWFLGEMLVPPLAAPTLQLPDGALLEARIDDPSGRQRYLNVSVLPGAFDLVDFGQPSASTSAFAFMELGAVAEIPLTPGLYSALVSPGTNAADYRYHTVVSEIFAGDHEVLQASLPDPVADLTLTGSVRRAPADTSSSISLYAYDAETQLLAETRVDNDGRYELPLPAGQYEIIARVLSPDGPRVGYHLPSLALTDDHTLDIDLFAPTAIADGSQAPARFELLQSYPNPFNAGTVIRFSLAAPGEARLELFDMLGQRLRTLVEAELPAGPAAARWDGTDAGGHPVASGVYFYRLTAGRHVATKRLLLLR